MKDYTLNREHFSLQTPDGKTVSLATQKEYMEAESRVFRLTTVKP